MHAPRPRARGIASALACAALLGACAKAAQPVYRAPSDRTVGIRTEAMMDGRGQYIVVENHSTVRILVTSLHLRGCENIKNHCELTRLRVPVPAGQTRRIATVLPANPDQAYNFSYSWSWGADETVPPLPGQ